MKVFDEAVSFYEENGYQFEVGGVFWHERQGGTNCGL
jgi:hypothetical protein